MELLDDREQFWINLLEPDYNNLKSVKSSRGYKHTQESLEKMRGARPQFKPSLELRAKLGLLAKNRVYDTAFKDAISEREGYTVYVSDLTGKLITTYSSIIRLKKAYGIKSHHKTLYKYIYQGKNLSGRPYIFILPRTNGSFN